MHDDAAEKVRASDEVAREQEQPPGQYDKQIAQFMIDSSPTLESTTSSAAPGEGQNPTK